MKHSNFITYQCETLEGYKTSKINRRLVSNTFLNKSRLINTACSSNCLLTWKNALASNWSSSLEPEPIKLFGSDKESSRRTNKTRSYLCAIGPDESILISRYWLNNKKYIFSWRVYWSYLVYGKVLKLFRKIHYIFYKIYEINIYSTTKNLKKVLIVLNSAKHQTINKVIDYRTMNIN